MIFDYLNSNSTLEEEPLAALAEANQLMSFQHDGFWEAMDTFRESQMLNQMWKTVIDLGSRSSFEGINE